MLVAVKPHSIQELKVKIWDGEQIHEELVLRPSNYHKAGTLAHNLSQKYKGHSALFYRRLKEFVD